jgi:hypothetical protein
MSSILFTFLGRVPNREYKKTSYTFDDGFSSGPVAFFGWPLQKRIRAERLVIMGTDASMWEHLIEGDVDLGTQAQAARTSLIDAASANAVTRRHLEPFEAPLSEHLACEVRLALILDRRRRFVRALFERPVAQFGLARRMAGLQESHNL